MPVYRDLEIMIITLLIKNALRYFLIQGATHVLPKTINYFQNIVNIPTGIHALLDELTNKLMKVIYSFNGIYKSMHN
jgi:hypothetical protein